MLTEHDVAWIKSNRTETTRNRLRRVAVAYEDAAGSDPYTGEPITEIRYSVADVIWTEVTNVQLKMVDGILAEEGDIVATFDINFDLTSLKYVINDPQIIYNIAIAGVANISDVADGKLYRVVAVTPKGIGVDNRIITLLRRVI